MILNINTIVHAYRPWKKSVSLTFSEVWYLCIIEIRNVEYRKSRLTYYRLHILPERRYSETTIEHILVHD